MCLEAQGLSKRYGTKTVLRAEQFKAQPAAITAVIGPSGAGKSTLMRLLAGLEPATSGQIRFGQKQALSLSQLRRHAGLVLQQPIAFRGSALYNATLALRLAGVKRREAQRRALAALAQVGLAELAYQEAQKLSGGELVRLSLARVLVREPDVLLLDEATANLDPDNISRIETIISDYARAGHTVIMVTHNLAQAKRLSQATAVIYNHELIAQDASKLIFGAYKHPLVAAFTEGELVY